jgi:pimeloyl-ACP methyl ester carboxylesterase
MYADDCEQKFGWLLPYMTTEDVARDMDSIRAAFGVAKINYFAFSYGTYIGQVYATLFPSRIRRMVLDSTVDPTGVWYTDNVDQDYAFQGRIERVLRLGGSIRRYLSISAAPPRRSRPPGTGPVTSCSPTRSTGRSAPTSSMTPSCSAATWTSCGRAWPRRSRLT